MKEIIKIDRGSIIDALMNSTLDHLEMVPEDMVIYLKYGFQGFENYSDEDLIFAYRDYISEDASEDIEIILEKA